MKEVYEFGWDLDHRLQQKEQFEDPHSCTAIENKKLKDKKIQNPEIDLRRDKLYQTSQWHRHR